MLRLALDTSTSPGSVAVAEGELLLAETLLPVHARGSETALPEVDRLLSVSGRGPGELDAVVVGAGPGSFTGVRIAAALAKGLCQARGVPLFAYGSLAAVAVGTGVEGRVCAAFDARRGQLYAAAYGRLEPPEPILGPAVLPVEELLERLERPAEWTFAGEGASLHADRIEAAGGRVLARYLGIPRGAALLWLAWRWPAEGRIEHPADWEPEYVRRSGAERAVAGGRPAGQPAGEGSRV